MIKVAINGFGRIGRLLARIILENNIFQLVKINDIYDPSIMKYLFENDTVYGCTDQKLTNVSLSTCKEIEKLDWSDIDILFECSGVYTKKAELSSHIENGAKKVILSAFSKELPVFIMGINEMEYKKENIISSSSCTANCIVPVLSIIDKYFGVKKCYITTIHSYTSEQNLIDNKNIDLRRARSAPNNIIPLSSNVANATLYFLPHLKNKIFANSIRVPIENGVLIDLHIELSNKTNLTYTKEILAKHIDKKVVDISKNPIVSKDIKSIKYSATIDEELMQLVENKFLRIMLWQDNEFAYARRVIEIAKIIGK